jgi:hypothetical protein
MNPRADLNQDHIQGCALYLLSWEPLLDLRVNISGGASLAEWTHLPANNGGAA